MSLYCNIDDLSQLCGPFSDDVIVKALQQRFAAGKLSTHLGPLLISVNPLTSAHGIRTLVDTGSHSHHLEGLVDQVLKRLRQGTSSQAVIMNGISGSGKTFLTHQFLRQLFQSSSGSMSAFQTDTFKHVSAAAVALHPLTTALTTTNPDSSRAAVHLEVQMSGSAVHNVLLQYYLIDFTRVSHPPKNERNFHIFYQMFAALTLEEREKLHLAGMSISKLQCLNNSVPDDRETQWNTMRFNSWKLALAELGIPLSDIVRILSAILLLGNVCFVDSQEGSDLEVIGNTELKAASALLGISGASLYAALTRRELNCTRGPHNYVSANAAQTMHAKALLMQSLYIKTIDILIRRINTLKRPESRSTISSDSGSESYSLLSPDSSITNLSHGTVHVVDFCGFETACRNQFEQLLTNTTAEVLHQVYLNSMFRDVETAAVVEGVCLNAKDAGPISESSGSVLNLLLNDNEGIIPMLNNCKNGISVINGKLLLKNHNDDNAFIGLVRSKHKLSDYVFESNPANFNYLGIRHSFTRCLYDFSGFANSNFDQLSPDVASIFTPKTCTFAFACYIFRSLQPRHSNGTTSSSNLLSPKCRNGKSDEKKTRSHQIVDIIQSVKQTISICDQVHVLCIKPNLGCEPGVFDKAFVAQQVRTFCIAQVLEKLTTDLSCKISFPVFLRRYKHLLRGSNNSNSFTTTKRGSSAPVFPISSDKDTCVDIMKIFFELVEEFNIPYRNCKWAIGTKHIFINEELRQQLEAMPLVIENRQRTRRLSGNYQSNLLKSPGKAAQVSAPAKSLESGHKSLSWSDLRQVSASYMRPKLFRKPVPEPPQRRSSLTNTSAPSPPTHFTQRHKVRSRSRTPETLTRSKSFIASAGSTADSSPVLSPSLVI